MFTAVQVFCCYSHMHGHGCTCNGAKQIKINCPYRRCNHVKEVQDAHFMPIVGVGKRGVF